MKQAVFVIREVFPARQIPSPGHSANSDCPYRTIGLTSPSCLGIAFGDSLQVLVELHRALLR